MDTLYRYFEKICEPCCRRLSGGRQSDFLVVDPLIFRHIY